MLFSIIMSIFQEFPEKLESFMTQNKLSNFEMLRDIKVVPYWYEKSVNEISPKIVYFSKMVSEEEILNYFAMGESFSNHPIAKSILKKAGSNIDTKNVINFKEVSG